MLECLYPLNRHDWRYGMLGNSAETLFGLRRCIICRAVDVDRGGWNRIAPEYVYGLNAKYGPDPMLSDTWPRLEAKVAETFESWPR